MLARRHPRYGYRRVHVLLKREGWACNRKRVQRLWRDEGLHVPRRKRRRRKAARTPGSVTATCPDQVWALDYLFDQTADGRPIKILNITDEHTREALACHAARSINADQTVAVLESLIETRGRAPAHIRCDNGPELVADTLRDWCRYAGTSPHYIEPGAPWQNPYVERLIGSIRRECLDHTIIFNERHLRGVLSSYFQYYHEARTHLSLNKDCPQPRRMQPPSAGKIVVFPEVGGLHHRYERRAA